MSGRVTCTACEPLPSFDSSPDARGERFMRTVPAEERRRTGSTYTPLFLVREMVKTAHKGVQPSQVVDCGCGSGRFAIACARAFPDARVIAVDSSSAACDLCRENVRAQDLGRHIEVVCEDFLTYVPPCCDGPTLWIGNPPYVRHHDIDGRHKAWFADTTESLGMRASLLSGMHAYFLAHVAQIWRQGDYGVFVTGAEWLDTNYGSFLRWLLLERLGLKGLELYDRHTRVFDGTDVTTCVISFGDGPLGPSDLIGLRSHGSPWQHVPRSTLASAPKWSPLVAGGRDDHGRDDSLVPLGSIASVHRGVVTGNNAFWVRDPGSLGNIPEALTVPIVSHAREIRSAQEDPGSLRRLVALPADLSQLDAPTTRAAERLIAEGRARGIDRGYVASHRKPWWSVKVPKAPAIMMTYMGRSGPTFVLNESHLPMLNVIHGIYPRGPMSHRALARLVAYLNTSVSLTDGRMYSGGLVKFEPREAEAIPVPPLETLEA